MTNQDFLENFPHSYKKEIITNCTLGSKKGKPAQKKHHEGKVKIKYEKDRVERNKTFSGRKNTPIKKV